MRYGLKPLKCKQCCYICARLWTVCSNKGRRAWNFANIFALFKARLQQYVKVNIIQTELLAK